MSFTKAAEETLKLYRQWSHLQTEIVEPMETNLEAIRKHIGGAARNCESAGVPGLTEMVSQASLDGDVRIRKKIKHSSMDLDKQGRNFFLKAEEFLKPDPVPAR